MDDQNWQPGDTAESVLPLENMTTRNVVEPGAIGIVTKVIMGMRRNGEPGIGIYVTGFTGSCDAIAFRKIISTFEEPKVSDMVTL